MSGAFPPDPTPPSERREWRTDAEWRRLRERVDAAERSGAVSSVGSRRSGARRRMLGAAATIVIAIGATWGVSAYRARRTALPESRTASAPAGERVVVHLGDSSIVTLGPASTMRYTVSPTRREIELVGLANFKVAHDSTRPFIVRAKNAMATDIGTEFVVRAYSSDSTVQVAVTSGTVELSGADASRVVRLRAGNLGRVNVDGTVAPASDGNASARAAWVDGRLVFDDDSFADVAAELSRWFDVDIRISTADLGRRRVTAIYNAPSLSGVLEALTATLDARYERAERVVTILPRGR